MSADEVVRAGIGWVIERPVALGCQHDVTQSFGRRCGDRGAEPLLVDDLTFGSDPRPIGERRPGRLEKYALAPWSGVEPPEPGLARLQRNVFEHVGRQPDDIVTRVDLTMIGGHHEHRPWRQEVTDLRDQTIAPGDLGVEVPG